jgi:AcrR family transcriptional regulator
LILDAARELFAARGYAGTTTRDVAEEANVVEAAIYRHFGTKAKLFEAAVAEPYHEFIASASQKWRAQIATPISNAELIRDFVASFYNFLRDNRQLVLAFAAFSAFERSAFDNGRAESLLSRELDQFEDMVRSEAERRGLSQLDFPITVRCTAGLVMALALHDELLFPQGPRHPSRERIIRETVAYMLRGLEARDAVLPPPPIETRREARS